jgi:hypothetical protein
LTIREIEQTCIECPEWGAKMRSLAFAMALCLSVTAALAQDIPNERIGLDKLKPERKLNVLLTEACSGATAERDQISCWGYVLGVTDALQQSDEVKVCYPKNWKLAFDVVRNYLRVHPDEVLMAFKVAFPC